MRTAWKRDKNSKWKKEEIYYKGDLIDDKNERYQQYRRFESYQKLYEPLSDDFKKEHGYHYHTKAIAALIINAFLDILIRDLIYNSNTFVFPKKGFGRLKIRDAWLENRRYDIKTEGKYYILGFVMGRMYRRYNRLVYVIRLSKKYYKMLIDEVHNGHRY